MKKITIVWGLVLLMLVQISLADPTADQLVSMTLAYWDLENSTFRDITQNTFDLTDNSTTTVANGIIGAARGSNANTDDATHDTLLNGINTDWTAIT